MANPNFVIQPARTKSDLTAVRTLFTSYASSLGIDLSFQSFATELTLLPGSYSPPTGIILLAYARPNPDPTQSPSFPSITTATPHSPLQALGCVALRPLPVPSGSSHRICEMKRLYCTPASRGMGMGLALAEEIIARAREMDYDEMRLDTLPNMQAARGVYERLGFEKMEGYYSTPLVGTIFLRKVLK